MHARARHYDVYRHVEATARFGHCHSPNEPQRTQPLPPVPCRHAATIRECAAQGTVHHPRSNRRNGGASSRIAHAPRQGEPIIMNKSTVVSPGHVSIGHLAKAAGVSSRTIRYYEELGILPEPRRSPRGTRKYPKEDGGYSAAAP